MRERGAGRIVNVSSMGANFTATRSVYERGPLARLGGGPEAVARAIARALTARRAPVRVRVTPSAHLLVLQRRVLPDRAWDRMMRTQFPTPSG